MHIIKLLHSIPNYVLKFCFETVSIEIFVAFLFFQKYQTWLERFLLKCCLCIPGPIMQTTQAYLFQGQKWMVRTIATVLDATCCARLATLLWGVSTCWVLAQIWKLWSFSCNICGCCSTLWSFGQVRATVLHPAGMRTSLISNTQHVGGFLSPFNFWGNVEDYNEIKIKTHCKIIRARLPYL